DRFGAHGRFSRLKAKAALGMSVRQNRVAASETRARLKARAGYDIVLNWASSQSIVSWGDPRFSNAGADAGLFFFNSTAQYRRYEIPGHAGDAPSSSVECAESLRSGGSERKLFACRN